MDNRKSFIKGLFFVLFLLCAFFSESEGVLFTGQTFLEVAKAPLIIKKATRGVVALLNESYPWEAIDESFVSFRSRIFSYQETYGLCPSEKKFPFVFQKTFSNCSGILLSPSILLTAGHCVENRPCKNQRWGLGETDFLNGIIFDKKKVFACKKILFFKNSSNYIHDFALLEVEPLEKSQTGNSFLKELMPFYKLSRKEVSSNSVPKSILPKGQKRFILAGHPRVSMHYSAVDNILGRYKDLLFTNHHYLRGMSGGPLIDLQDQSIKGILVGGSDEVYQQHHCQKIKVCEKVVFSTRKKQSKCGPANILSATGIYDQLQKAQKRNLIKNIFVL